MQLPIAPIKPAIELISKRIDVLPATGGAVEDLQRLDEDELEDMLINRESGEITAFAETLEPSVSSSFRPTPPIFRKANIDYLIDEQSSEGSWDPAWSWSDFYPQE